MNSKEALNLLSYLKLGIDLGFFPEREREVVDELFITTQPAHLQKGTAAKLQADERDALRAAIIRERVVVMPEPSGVAAAQFVQPPIARKPDQQVENAESEEDASS
jgi:protein arginine kinase